MEALVAVGLASNIVSFVDFGLQVLSTGKDIHASIDGLTTAHSQLKMTASRIQALCHTLTSERRKAGRSGCKHDVAICEIAGECIAVGEELHSLLKKLSGSGQKGWTSIKKAIQSVWKDSKIRQVSARLEQCVKALQVHLIASLTDSRSSLSAGLTKLADQHRHLGIALMSSVEQQKKEILDALHNSQETLKQGEFDASQAQVILLGLSAVALGYAKERKVIEALKFTKIRNRFNNIHESKTGTYNWIYDDEHLDHKVRFSEWLREGQGTYFLTGKPGSGKSTMMKHVHEHSRTTALLQEWAAESTLVTVSYFFWNSGVALQKSQEGLFRTLLHDILQQHPDLVHTEIQAARNQMKTPLIELILDDSGVDANVLVKCLQNIFRITEERLKFCIFVDGIDEYAGYPTEIVDAIKKLTTTTNVKLCVSSRPWNIFEFEFKGTGRYYLEMHKHTLEDMQEYIHQTLEQNDSFKEAAMWDTKFRDLTQLLVTKAEGVFLWAFLVTRKIRDNLINGESIEHCIKEVDALSSDLDDFFSHMLNTIPTSYKEETSRAILMALEAEGPIPVLTITMALDPAKNALKNPIEPVTELTLMRHSVQARKQLKVRCQDLFEPAIEGTSHSWMIKHKLEVLHRSIYDWLRLPKIQKKLQSAIAGDYDPNLQVCEGYLLQLKSMPTVSTQIQQTLEEIVHGFFRHAKALEDKVSPNLAALLIELRRTMTALRTRSFPQVDWAHYTSLRIEIPRSKTKSGSGDPVLPFAVRWRINSYVQSHCQLPAHDLTAADNAQNMDGYCPLYLTLMEQTASVNDAEDMSSHLDTVKLLLIKGANPNQLCGGKCVWAHFLDILQKTINRENDRWRLHLIEIFDLLVKYGSTHPNRGVVLHQSHSRSVRDLIHTSFRKDEMPRIESILAQHESRGWDLLTGWFSAGKNRAGKQNEHEDEDEWQIEDEDEDEWQIVTSPSKLETMIMDTKTALSRAARLLTS